MRRREEERGGERRREEECGGGRMSGAESGGVWRREGEGGGVGRSYVPYGQYPRGYTPTLVEDGSVASEVPSSNSTKEGRAPQETEAQQAEDVAALAAQLLARRTSLCAAWCLYMCLVVSSRDLVSRCAHRAHAHKKSLHMTTRMCTHDVERGK